MQTENWKKVKAILDEVLSVEPSKRREFLEDQTVDREIRVEVESLLGFEDRAENALQLSAVDFSRDFFDNVDGKNPLINQQIGVYRIIRELGSGGMGAVFLAERTDGKFSQIAALKILKREMNTEILRRRFETEREILASLDHPHIARLLDAGTSRDNIPYIAMEYVEGMPLDEYADKNALNLDQRLDLFCKLCEAIDFAHRNLIVHRDLKPSNIFVTNEGVPKLLDFGISKILNENFAESNAATITSMGVLTPSYASPEQLMGKSVTTATDIYSLGVILYELLSGHRPFENSEKDLKQIYDAVVETDPPLPSAVRDSGFRISDLKNDRSKFEKKRTKNQNRKTNPKSQIPNPKSAHPKSRIPNPKLLSGDLDNIILKSLKKEPERRYATAGLFAEDIKRHQNGLPVSARPDTFSYRAGKFIKRNSLAVTAAALILLAIFGGLIATLWQARAAQTERAKAEKRFNEVRELANSFLFEITPEIENLPGSTRAKELLVKRALKYLDALSMDAGENPELQRELAAAYEKVGDVQGNVLKANIGDTKGALESYRKAGAIRTKLFENNKDNIELKAELAKNSQLIGDVLFSTGEVKKAVENYRQAVDWQREIISQNPPDLQRAQIALASAEFALGRTFFWNSQYDDALKYYYSAQEILRKTNQADSSGEEIIHKLADTYVHIGDAYSWQGKPEKGLKEILKGSEMIEPLVGRNPNNILFRKSLWTANLKAGEVYLDLEKYGESLKHYEKALELAKNTADADPENVSAKRDLALSYNKIGDALDSIGKGESALANIRKALKFQQEIAAADEKNFNIRFDIANTFKRMGYAQATMKNFAGSEKSFQNALNEYKKLAVSDPNDNKVTREIAVVSQIIGETYLLAAEESGKTENLNKALKWHEKSLELMMQMKADKSLPATDDKLIEKIQTQIAQIESKR